MQRIMIIGGPGSGKSTLARRLGARLDLPVFYMDREVHWLPNWQERPKAEKMPLVEAIIAQEAWVFEGGHSASYGQRLARAELLIWLDTPLWLRLWRVICRSFQQRGQVRADLQAGCAERLSMLPGFLWFILRIHRAAYRRQAALYAQATIPKRRFASARAVNAYLKGL